jgi:hypothetical protein
MGWAIFGHGRHILGMLSVLAMVLPAPAGAPPRPVLGDMQPRGLQIGATTHVVLTGTGLDDSLQLISSASDSMHVRVELADGNQAHLQITLDAEVEAGIYPLRVATEGGVSNTISIGIDRLPQIAFRESIDSLPVALHGRLGGHQVLQAHFSGIAGKRMVVDVEAQRLGSKLRPTLRIYSPANRLIGIAQPTQQMGGDARLDLKLPEDGSYRLELQDIVYDAGEANWFRLKLGDLKYADGVFPLAVSSAADAEVALVASNIHSDTKLLPSAAGTRSPLQVAWPDSSEMLYTGAAPLVHRSPWGVNEWTEEVVRLEPERLRAPLGINGRLSAPGEQDEYDVWVQPGEKLSIEVHADRWGSPLDAVLLVANPDGLTLAQADDQPDSADPRVDVDVPADVSRLRVRVSSRVVRGGERYVYRLSVGPRRRPPPVLEAELDGLNLPAGEVVVVPVQIDHRGEPRAMRLSLPAALEHVVEIDPRRLDATDELGLVCFSAAPTARGVFRGWVQADCQDCPADEPAWLTTGRFPGSDYQPHWRQELMIAVTAPSSLRLAWSDDEAEYLARGTTRPLAVRVERHAGVSGPVRLSLMSSQRPPQKQVEGLPQPDEARTLRLAESVVIPVEEDQSRVMLVTPADLPLHAWSFAVKAELLGADEQQVVAMAFTPLRRWTAIAPLRVTWDATSPLTLPAGELAGRVLKGRIERHPDFDFAVLVQLQGLSESETPPAVTVPAGESDFEITLTSATQSPMGEAKEVRLLATLVEPTEGNREISSQTDAVQLQVTAAASP